MVLNPPAPRFLPCGDAALTVEFAPGIDAAANALALALATDLEAAPLPGLREALPTYRSLTLTYDPCVTGFATLRAALIPRIAALRPGAVEGALRSIPVFYGGPACLDLARLATEKGMAEDALIALHLGADYRVAMIGFAPGFAYLSGLPAALATPRRAEVRQRVPEGALGIGGGQASVNSVAAPSAWSYIGQTPLRLFDARRARPCLLAPGDRLRLRRIGEAEFDTLAARARRGEILFDPETPA